MNTPFKYILIMISLLIGGHIVAEDKSYVSKSELGNPLTWFFIDSYDIAVLYSIFFKSHEDLNDKTAKIATLKRELIDDGIPLVTLAYAKVAYSTQVNEVLSFFNAADKPTCSAIVYFVDWSYNKDRVYSGLPQIKLAQLQRSDWELLNKN